MKASMPDSIKLPRQYFTLGTNKYFASNSCGIIYKTLIFIIYVQLVVIYVEIIAKNLAGNCGSKCNEKNILYN